MVGAIFVVAIGLALAWSVVLFAKAVSNRRPQTPGAVWSLVTLCLYVIHYADRLGGLEKLRLIYSPLELVGNPDIYYPSSIAMSVAVAVLYLPRALVFGKVAKRRSLQRLNDLLAPYLALVTAATCAWLSVRALYHLAWLSSSLLALAMVGTIVLGLAGALAALIEWFVELFKSLWLHLQKAIIPVWKTLLKTFAAFAKFRKDVAGSLRASTRSRRTRNEEVRVQILEKTEDAIAELEQIDLPEER